MRDINTESEALALGGEDFYQHLVSRNRGLVSAETQAVVSDARVLVAGCGSIGGAAIEPLARIGFQDLHLADSGTYELNNLNRQRARVSDLGHNKAVVAGHIVESINPHARVRVTTEGVTQNNANELVRNCDVIVDGVDVTTRSGLLAKVALHEAALAHRKPLVTGWDLAGALCAEVIDYRNTTRIFNGAISVTDIDQLTLWESITRIAPMSAMPTEMLNELADNLRKPDYSVPQLPEAAWQFGSLACHLVVRIVSGQPVPQRARVDVHDLTRPWHHRVIDQIQRPIQFVRFAAALGIAGTLRATAPQPLLQFL